jgi:hypothetical protein
VTIRASPVRVSAIWSRTAVSASTAPNGTAVIIRDPRTGVPFPNNTIPSNRLSSVASNYLKNYYQVPNAGSANTFTQNYTWNHPYGPDTYIGNWPFGRIDQPARRLRQCLLRCCHAAILNTHCFRLLVRHLRLR